MEDRSLQIQLREVWTSAGDDKEDTVSAGPSSLGGVGTVPLLPRSVRSVLYGWRGTDCLVVLAEPSTTGKFFTERQQLDFELEILVEGGEEAIKNSRCTSDELSGT